MAPRGRRTRARHLLALAVAGIASTTLLTVGPARATVPDDGWFLDERVNVATDGTQANDDSFDASVSADGRYVAFGSNANNLVAGDTNGVGDIFVRDLQFGTTTRVSVSTNGAQANSYSGDPRLSADGRFVAFYSNASNLVANDTNQKFEIFVHDRQEHTTTRVSVGDAEEQGNGHASQPSISADGRYVAFNSEANNLVPDDTNGFNDVFVRDTQLDTTTRVGVGTDGSQLHAATYPTITPDGRYVAFTASNQGLVRDTVAGTTTAVGAANDGRMAISDDGRSVAFWTHLPLVPGDTNGFTDIYLRDLVDGVTTRVSVDGAGQQANHESFHPLLSADGRYVAFTSRASNLVPDDTNGEWDAFVHDRETGAVTRMVDRDGGQLTDAGPLAMTPDARFLVVRTATSDVVPGDTNGVADLFLARRDSGPLTVTVTADQAEVAVGATIDYHLTIANDGDETLTGLIVTDPQVPDCSGAVPDLAAGAQTTVDCSYTTTVADLGIHANQAIVDSDQTGPAYSNRVLVTVLGVPGLEVSLDAEQASVVTGQAIDYQVIVTNTGSVALTGVSLTDQAVPDCDRSIGTLAVGAHHQVDCAHTPTPADVGTFQNRVTADSDQTGVVTSSAVDVGVELYHQPDLKLRRHRGPRIGDDVYALDPGSQTVQVQRPPGGRGIFYLSVQNDGHGAERMGVRPVGTADPSLRIRYFAGRSPVDITRAVRAGTYRTRSLSPGETATIRIEATVRGGAQPGPGPGVTLRARSSATPGARDTVRAAVSVG